MTDSDRTPGDHHLAAEKGCGQITYIGAALVLVLCAAFLRFSWSDWDGGHLLHPDERFLTIVSSSISVPEQALDYFNATRSSLNPRNKGQEFYAYGDLPITLTRIVAEALVGVCSAPDPAWCQQANGDKRQWTSYREIVFVGRWLSAVMDMGTLLWLFLLARFLFGQATGLVALGLGTFCVLQIQLAHFFIVDSFSAQFTTAGLFFVCRSARYGHLRDFAWAGVAIGAAMACRVNMAPLALLCLPAALSTAVGPRSFHIRGFVFRLAIAAISTVVAFRVFMPNAFSGLVQFDPRWIENIATAIELRSPMNFYPPGVQWTNRLPWLFPLKDIAFWGMGVGLAVAGIAGWLRIGSRALRASHIRQEGNVNWIPRLATFFKPATILWLWTGAYFLWAGGWPNPTMRYFLPIYPPLIIFAAFFLARLWSIHSCGVAKWAGRAIVVLVVATTAIWAIAFTEIYRSEHSRVAASEWIVEQLPADSLIGVERWDDALPFGPGKGHETLPFNHYEDDTPDKRERLLLWLDQVDYIVLSSNRLYASIPRLPLRFPLAIHYYRLLFSGKLGFSLLTEFHSFPRIGHWEFPDQEGVEVLGEPHVSINSSTTDRMHIRFPAADESFSVYDHPRVLIFQKEVGFNYRKLAALLGEIDLDTGLRGLPPAIESRVPTGLMLDSAQLAASRAGGTWSQLFERDALVNLYPVLGAVTMYAFISVLGWLMWPIAFWFLPGLQDRGLMMTRTLSLLLGGAGAWFLAAIGFMKFDRLHIGLCLILLTCVSAIAAWRQRTRLLAFLRSNGRLVLHGEVLFVAAYVFALVIRWHNPDLWHPFFGGEKPMDYAFLNAVLKSDYFPPYDPWFSGGYINYFYFGFVLAALPVKVIGIVPEVAYHLACATFYALAACGVYSVAYTLASRTVHPRTTAMLAVGFVLVMGNLGQLELASKRVFTPDGAAATTGNGDALTTVRSGVSRLVKGQVDFQFPGHHWFWDASRSIPPSAGEPGPITEFPYFSLLYGDLHAHFIALPLTLLVLGIALSWWRRPPLDSFYSVSDWPRLVIPALGGAILGAVRMTNAWDLPTYLGLAVLAFTAGIITGNRENRVQRLVLGLTIFFISFFAFTLPFESAFATGYTNLIPWSGSRTMLGNYLIIHGVFLFPILGYLWLERRKFFPSHDPVWNSRPLVFFFFWFAVGLLILIAISASLKNMPVLIITVPVAVLAAEMMLNSRVLRTDRAWAALVLCAALLTVLVEMVSLEGDAGRMNSVFKAYYQVWVLWGLCAAVATAWIWSRKPQRGTLRLWRASSAVLIAGGLAYTVLATPARLLQRFDPDLNGGLNGVEYMNSASYSEHRNEFELRWDHDAIRWLQENVSGTPVIAEGRSVHEYLWGNRISVYTGLPTILGWRNHQVQQRSILPVGVIERRARDVDTLYRDPDPKTALQIIRRYDVSFIYAGMLERAYYPAAGMAKFDRLERRGVLEIAYRNPGVVIYIVRPSGAEPDAPDPLLKSAR